MRTDGPTSLSFPQNMPTAEHRYHRAVGSFGWPHLAPWSTRAPGSRRSLPDTYAVVVRSLRPWPRRQRVCMRRKLLPSSEPYQHGMARGSSLRCFRRNFSRAHSPTTLTRAVFRSKSGSRIRLYLLQCFCRNTVAAFVL
jgi:hypothetical protein